MYPWRSDLASRGFALLKAVGAEKALDVARALGTPRADSRSQELARQIRPQEAATSFPNSLSATYGIEAFPLHSEAAYWPLPPRYVVLGCENPGSGHRPTTLWNSSTHLSGELLDCLAKEIWIVSRIHRPFLTTVFDPASNCFRFDPVCMRPVKASSIAAKGLSTAIENAIPFDVAWDVGDILIIDNYRLLHGRGRSTVPDDDRKLIRVLVQGDAVA